MAIPHMPARHIGARTGSRSASNVEIIARALCYGISLPKQLSGNGPIWALEPGFIQGSVLLFNGVRPINTAILDRMAGSPKAIPLVEENGNLFITWEGNQIPCPILDQPLCLTEKVSEYGRIGDYLKFHAPGTLFATPVRQCVFGAIGKPCQFCTFEMVTPKPLPPDVFGNMFERVRAERRIDSLAIGAGTPNLNDHGVRYFCNLIKSISTKWHGGISVELVPPHDTPDIELLVNAGAKSLIMSIEVWDDTRRLVLCPGKSYVPKEKYLEAWSYAIERLGRGTVSSVLLVGLEPVESTKRGIDKLCALGVVPTLIPYRAYDHTAASLRIEVDHEEYIDVSKHNIYSMEKHNIGPRLQVGCTQCGGCSLDIERPWESVPPKS